MIEAIGLKPSTSPFKDQVALNNNGTIKVDGKTLQTSVPYIFAGGDSVTGATTLIEAAGQGKKAAFYMDKFLRDLNMYDFEDGDKLPAVDKEPIINRRHLLLPQVEPNMKPLAERARSWEEVEQTYTEDQVKEATARCLDCSNCRECHQCVSACPSNAIDFTQ